jgi:hypothetical protein
MRQRSHEFLIGDHILHTGAMECEA